MDEGLKSHKRMEIIQIITTLAKNKNKYKMKI